MGIESNEALATPVTVLANPGPKWHSTTPAFFLILATVGSHSSKLLIPK